MCSMNTDRFNIQPHQNGGLKAIIFTAYLIGFGWAGVATAEQHEGNSAPFHRLASIMAYCNTMATSSNTDTVQMLPERVEDSTELADLKIMHACQYMRETAASGCLDQGECKSYDDWSASHPEISLKLPAGSLKTALNERRLEVERPK